MKHIPTAAEIRRNHTDPGLALDEVIDALYAIDQRRSDLHDTTGDRELSASAQRQWDALTRQREDLEAARAEYEAAVGAEKSARMQRVHESRARWGSTHVNFGDRRDKFTGDAMRMRDHEVRDAAKYLLDDQSTVRHLRTEQLDKLDKLIDTRTPQTDGSWIARAMLLTENDAYRSAFQRSILRPRDPLTAEEAAALRAYDEFRALSIGNPHAGAGLGVPVLIDPSIVLTAQGSANPFWDIARVETITTDAWKGVSSAGVSWAFQSEGSEVSDNSPTLAQPTVPAHMARGFIPYSIEVGQDYPGFAAEMGRLLTEGFDELCAQKFVNGSGNGEPTGIITALDANTNVEVLPTSDGVFQAADISKVWKELPDRFKANATWVMSHDVAEDVAAFGNGNNLSFVTVDLTNVVSTLRQRPVRASSYFPGSIATTGKANILVVGDFRHLLVAVRAGMSVETVPHLFGSTNGYPTGQRGLFAWSRVGSDSIADEAFRILQNG